MSQRQEFVAFARQEEVTIAAVCRHFGISRKTGYTWLERAAGDDAVLADRSRQPHASPWRPSPAVEERVLALRAAHPAWGGCISITAMLRRHRRLAAAPPPRGFVRFEHASPAPAHLSPLYPVYTRTRDLNLDKHYRFHLIRLVPN